MSKFITLENQGVDIQDYNVNGVMYTLISNTCRDLPEEVAQKLVEAFPQLRELGSMVVGERVVGGFVEVNGSLEDSVAEPTENIVLTPKEQFESDLTKNEKFFCSECGREFNKMHGLRIHQKVHETK